jgi:hypothetical protein
MATQSVPRNNGNEAMQQVAPNALHRHPHDNAVHVVLTGKQSISACGASVL